MNKNQWRNPNLQRWGSIFWVSRRQKSKPWLWFLCTHVQLWLTEGSPSYWLLLQNRCVSHLLGFVIFFYVSFIIQVRKNLQQTTDGLCSTATAGSTDLFPDISTQWKLYIFRGGEGESPVSTLTHKREEGSNTRPALPPGGKCFQDQPRPRVGYRAQQWLPWLHPRGWGTYCQFMSTRVSRTTAQP